jgi:hypothetical protein
VILIIPTQNKQPHKKQKSLNFVQQHAAQDKIPYTYQDFVQAMRRTLSYSG